ncbi:MAG: hypothetical protein AAGJ40_04300 [Planctomycetota bacterium]
MTIAAPTIAEPVSAASQMSRPSSQAETMLTDMEVMQRAYAIRSKWTITERMNRRREANERFTDLLDALSLPQEAA